MAKAGDTPEIYELSASAGRSRIRLSTVLLQDLGWNSHTEDFVCLGIFRTLGELICAPSWLSDGNGIHPFQEAISMAELPETAPITSLHEVPASVIATARYRLANFEASWLTGGKQLDLKIKVELAERLGWTGRNIRPIIAKPWRGILILMSNARFDYIQTQDFTGGLLNLMN